MIANLIRTCDLCHRPIPGGEHLARNLRPDDPDVLMVLMENQGRELRIIELPDGTVSVDTCRSCYTRLPFNHSTALN
jgi:hypothetical protein